MVDEKIFLNNTLDYMITLSPQDFHGKIFWETLLQFISCNKLIKHIVSVLM